MYHPVVKPVAELARMFGNAIIVRKGITDIISDGSSAFYVTQYGSAKRCSGTGDILVGVIAAYEQFTRQQVTQNEMGLLPSDAEFIKSRLFPCVMACVTLRKAANVAF